MTIEQALRATYADTHHVTDSSDLEKIREPLSNFRKNLAPYIGFVDEQYQDEYHFLADSAHIVTKKPEPDTAEAESEDGSDIKIPFAEREPSVVVPKQLRHIKSSPGRLLKVPAYRFEARTKVPFLNELFRSEESFEDVASRLPESVGDNLLRQVQFHMVWALFASAEAQEHVIPCEPSEIESEVDRLVAENPERFSAGYSVLTNWSSCRHLSQGSDWRSIKDGSSIVKTLRVIGEGVAILVAHEPRQVGFIRIKTEPEVFSVVENICDGIIAGVGAYGFCVWGNAPVWKLDFREVS